jgi:hypothetical protein
VCKLRAEAGYLGAQAVDLDVERLPTEVDQVVVGEASSR